LNLALLQINPIVGDLSGNARKIADAIRRASARGADLAITPELCLLGYPPRDLLLSEGFVARSWQVLRELAAELRDAPPTLVGLAELNSARVGRPLFNAAAFIRDGQIERTFRKTLLPTYDVFDEDRYFEPSSAPQVLEIDGLRLGISICEDVWNDSEFWPHPRYRTDPIAELAHLGLSAIVNLSSSPFSIGKQKLRESMLARQASKHSLPVCYVNQVGGNDDLIFDGRSCAFDATGRLIARGAAFAEDIVFANLFESTTALLLDDSAPEPEIWSALVLGTRDYVLKCGFTRVLLGLSGGIDSAITAAIAAEALGAENVLGVLMPSPFSSRGSVDDSLGLAQNIGIRTLTLPIAEIMEAYEETLRGAFAQHERDVTEENTQARIRGNLLMALSNKYGALLLTTGNKSELAVGYCTIYGDMSGGLAVISDVPKTMIYRLARWRNLQDRPIIPEPIITKAPSAELRPNQTDQDSLPPYDVLDEILRRHIEQRLSAEMIVADGFDEAIVRRVLRLVKGAEFKRKQAAPGLKVTDRAFGTGWRMPIACKNWDSGNFGKQQG
jgi:NAD+ synthase (glutamine-hydrolysing)